MMSTTTGRSIMFVEAVFLKINEIRRDDRKIRHYDVKAVATTKAQMVHMTKRLLELQSTWKTSFSDKHPTDEALVNSWLRVDVGYHYTKREALETIRTHGLITTRERLSLTIGKRYGGESFGSGIYTSDHPTSFDDYGNVGLIVARLKGIVSPRLDIDHNTPERYSKNSVSIEVTKTITDLRPYHTVLGNKNSILTHSNPKVQRRGDEVVLKECSQVIPLVQFDKGLQIFRVLEKELQSIIDVYLNDFD